MAFFAGASLIGAHFLFTEETVMVNQDASDKTLIQIAKENGVFEIEPCNTSIDLEHEAGVTKLDLSSSQKIHIGSLLQQVPSLMAAGTMANAYLVRFPEGIPYDPSMLMQYKNGGLGTAIMGDNSIIEHASLHNLSTEAALFGAFTVMSIASSQYFLAQINSELKMMNLKIDKILEFLYGDKKAELISEISFTKYAYENYNSIMSHGQQRLATITSLKESKKVAMKDIEFYISDLDSTVKSNDDSDIGSLADKAFQIKESLELSTQLYIMSNLLEVYYSQNFDPDYVHYIEEEISSYIDKCEKRMISSFSVLGIRIRDSKNKLWIKIDKPYFEKRIGQVVESLSGGEKSTIRKSLNSVLSLSSQKTEYYISNDGDVYLKTV